MHNITLISTVHTELGKCNSDELYKIIETLQPEIIFDEIPPSTFDRFCLHKGDLTLPMKTIDEYAKAHKIERVPVNSGTMPSEAFLLNRLGTLRMIKRIADANGFGYSAITNTNKKAIKKSGFDYLNSWSYVDINNEINDVIAKGLKELNDIRLNRANESWKKVISELEEEMLQNIYDYSKDHCYERAIFLVEASHRKSMMGKIKKYQRKEQLKLNWTIYRVEERLFSYKVGKSLRMPQEI